MSKILAYLRTSTDKQDLNNQKVGIYEYARKKNIKIDDFIQTTTSSRQSQRERRIEELLELIGQGDTIIVTELSRLGRSTVEVIMLIDKIIERNVRVIAIKQGLDITKHDMNSKVMVTMFSLFSDLERDMISLRTKEALAARKASGVMLGKPKGTIQKSKYDKDAGKIKELLGLGLSVRKISKLLGYSDDDWLGKYIKKRGLREAAQNEASKNTLLKSLKNDEGQK